MNRKSRYNIKIDFNKSKDSYIFDKNTNKYFLDFFGQYATLALGYNNKIFKSNAFITEMKSVSKQKIVNNEILSDESKDFDKLFKNYSSRRIFDYFYYCCTGSLAVEAAIKTSMDYKKIKKAKIISFKGSFHGINGYGGLVTDRFEPVNQRLKGFPGNYWEHLDNPIYQYQNNQKIIDYNKIDLVINKLKKLMQSKDICCVLIEPIQCTYGDRYFPDIFFIKLRTLCDTYDIPLIFDEIQTGFCATGKIWHYENIKISPDILIFGKKTQLSGIMVKKKFSKIFQKPIRLEVTWDADITDMVRCKYIIKTFKKNKVLDNVKKMSRLFGKNLSSINKIKNLRYEGLLFAFDINSQKNRDIFVKEIHKKGLLCNPTRTKTVRLRPCLFVNSKEINEASSIIETTLRKIN